MFLQFSTNRPARTFLPQQSSQKSFQSQEILFAENNFLHARRAAVISVIFSVEWLKHLLWRARFPQVFTSHIFSSDYVAALNWNKDLSADYLVSLCSFKTKLISQFCSLAHFKLYFEGLSGLRAGYIWFTSGFYVSIFTNITPYRNN